MDSYTLKLESQEPNGEKSLRLDSRERLPTILRKEHRDICLVESDIDAFVEEDLDVSRLNRIHGYLWMAGRPLNARSLVRQRMMGYDILQTDRADLHLIKFSKRMLVKPLPAYLVDFEFWEQHLCRTRELHECACGFFMSYIWLVCSPHDWKIAFELDLLPAGVTWPRWKALVRDFMEHVNVNTLHQVNKRYCFGELRLSRINMIYRVRFFFTHFIRGYLYGYNRYEVFFQRNIAWVLSVFVYFSLILSAMQVGLAVPPLSNDLAFQRASYGFVVFSNVVAAFFLFLPAVIFVSVFLFNMVAASTHVRRDVLERSKLQEENESRETANRSRR